MFLPLYTLGILIVIKIIIPNPNFPVMSTPRGEAVLFEHFQQFKNHTIAIVPNSTETQVSISHLSIIGSCGNTLATQEIKRMNKCGL